MEKFEKCDCCGKETEAKLNWHFRVPDVGYGSRFDYLNPEDVVEFTVCMTCFDRMNKWLVDNYPRINLNDFWHFAIVDVSEAEGLPQGYMRELKYDDELFRLMMRFMPEAFFKEKVNVFKKYIYRIIYAPKWGKK